LFFTGLGTAGLMFEWQKEKERMV
ncbi:hypothetical protein LCGC14_0867700, partial [marine sediment metagenome]